MAFIRPGLAGAALLGVALVLTACTAADPRGAQAAAVLDDALGEEEGPGCSAAVAEKGEVVWTYVRGLADVEKGTRIETATRFNIGSVSKQFTATAALMLAEQGALQLDDPISRYLDDLPAWSEEVTVADLMTHTSGLNDLSITDPSDKVVDRADRLRILRDHVGAHRENTGFHYSDDNYALLGLVVEDAGRADLAAWTREHIFEPSHLDMVIDPGSIADDVAIGYEGETAPYPPAPNDYAVVGPTGVLATPSELAVWGDHYREPWLLTADAMREALAAAEPVEGSDSEWHYGPGMFIFEDGLMLHDGLDAGMGTHFAISPDRGTALVISCNREIANAEPAVLDLEELWFGGKASSDPE